MPDGFAVEVFVLDAVNNNGQRAVAPVPYREASVRITVDGAVQTNQRSGHRYSITLNGRPNRIAIRVRDTSFHTVEETFSLRSTQPPTLEFAGGGRHIHTIDLRSASNNNGGGYTVTASVVLLRVGNIFDSADVIADHPEMNPQHRDDDNPMLYGVDFSTGTGAIWNWQRPWVTHEQQLIGDLSHAGNGRLRGGEHLIQHRGHIYFLERKASGAPFLVAVFVPWNIHLADRQPGIGYSLFLHPAVPGGDPADAFARRYVERAFYYLIEGRSLGNPQYAMHLTQRHWTARKRAVLVFPLGVAGQQLGGIMSRGAAMRMLGEINYWLQRQFGVSHLNVLQQPVDRVAVSCFSYSVNFAHSLIFSGSSDADWDALFGSVHKESYCFDPKNHPAGIIPDFAGWYRSDPDGRRLRVYTSDAEWGPDLASSLGHRMTLQPFINPGGTHTHHAGEFTGGPNDSLTCGYFPYRDGNLLFWQGMLDDADAHHQFPRRFYNHALRLSGFVTG